MVGKVVLRIGRSNKPLPFRSIFETTLNIGPRINSLQLISDEIVLKSKMNCQSMLFTVNRSGSQTFLGRFPLPVGTV